MDLDFGDIDVDCSTKDLSELCIVATAINHRRDKNEVNNKFCKNIPNLYVSTQEAPDFQFRLSPNPASDFLHLEVSEDIRAERYQIFAADGKKVQEGVFQADISVNGLSNGLYILVLNDAKGGYGSVRFLLH